MRTLLLAIIVSAWPLISHVNCVYAYNKPGHMVCGAMAYIILKEKSPGTLAKTVAILKTHPDFNRRWKHLLDSVAAEDRDMYLFMMAARWSDDVRGEPEYDHPQWHYINFGFKPVGQPEYIKVKPPAYENILRALPDQICEAKSDISDSEKAIALCWVFHLVGDLHLPVHNITLFTTDFPEGDRGATRFYIKPRQHSAATSLHYFWDDAVILSEDFELVRAKALELKGQPEYARDKLTELSEKNIENWSKAESCKLARDVVYRQGSLAGSPDKDSAPILPPDYAKKAKDVAQRRLVLSSYRLADILMDISQ
jgi:hypothetical protein